MTDAAAREALPFFSIICKFLHRITDAVRVGSGGAERRFGIPTPRQNRGAAVIRTEDPQGVREGYKLDVEFIRIDVNDAASA